MAQVWGHVGNYEVSVCLPNDDQRVLEPLTKSKPIRSPQRKR